MTKEKVDKKAPRKAEPKPKRLVKGGYPYPAGHAFIECNEMKCVGCGICQMACSMKHHGVINRELARIQVRRYLLPLPKAVQITCAQCWDERERECEKACPVSPPAIYYDEHSLHMVIDEDRCLGEKCLQCLKACSGQAIRIYPTVSPKPFVCDLCDTQNDGNRDPECVKACPYDAIHYLSNQELLITYSVPDYFRKNADEKAELIARRLYPLPKESMGYPGWRSEDA